MSEKDHTNYIHYYFEHPGEFSDQPPSAICGLTRIKKIQSGEATDAEMAEEALSLKKRWEDYHTAKAEDLGYKIYVDRLEWDMGWLARKLKALDDEPD